MGISKSYLKELAEKKKYQSGGFSTEDKQFFVKKSTIPGANKGLFSKTPIKQGKLIGLAHENNQPVGTLGNMHNHSETPNMQSVKVGNQRYVYATKDIQPGEELTTNYRFQPELEQPEDFMGNKRFGQKGFYKPDFRTKSQIANEQGTTSESTAVTPKINPVSKRLIDEANYERLKSQQPSFNQGYKKTASDIERSDYYRKQQESKNALKNALRNVDVVTDIMQVGNFIPHPIAQGIGQVGNWLGAATDVTQAGMDYGNEDYKNMAINLGSAGLSASLGGRGYTRDMYNTVPGSMADRIASFGSRSGVYRPLTALPHLRNNPVIQRGLNYNRAGLMSLGVEGAYDAGAFNNNTRLGLPINMQKPQYQMGGTMGIPGVNGQVVSSGPTPLTSVRKTRGPINKTKKGDVKTMSSKQVKQTLKYSKQKPNKI